MSPLPLIILLSSLVVSLSRAAHNRPHGLPNEYLTFAPAISPQANEFFNPALLPALAASVIMSTPAQESTAASTSGHHRGLGPKGFAAVTLSVVVFVGIGVYYVTIRRRANLRTVDV